MPRDRAGRKGPPDQGTPRSGVRAPAAGGSGAQERGGDKPISGCRRRATLPGGPFRPGPSGWGRRRAIRCVTPPRQSASSRLVVVPCDWPAGAPGHRAKRGPVVRHSQTEPKATSGSGSYRPERLARRWSPCNAATLAMALQTVTPIRRLPPATASRIAAGEVIERPLSALKEALENALDAEAGNVEVRIERSLDHAFQVADDGIGIAADQLELALERHATSKIAVLEDLDRLTSLGFRGEALPSIAAVSRLKIVSRPRDAEHAAMLRCEGGAVVARPAAARAPGTTVEVADLFFNTPARRKFLHSPAGELRAALRMLEAYALAWPGVGFRLLVDGRERFDCSRAVSGDAPEAELRRARAAALWGARHAEQLLEARGGG